MKKHIHKVAILGSGVMGSRIACHFANIGIPVLLLDIVPKTLMPDEEKKGLTLESKLVKNRIVNTALQSAINSNPSPLYLKSFASLITTGNFEDDFSQISNCDWIIEVVVERLDIKQQVFEKVEQFRKPGSLVTTNTSGIPIHFMEKGRSEDFCRNFCGTHFFNPPRYLKLLEIIPGTKTDPSVIDFLMDFGDLYLGKTTVLCKDTPAFIANRIGVFGIMAMFHLTRKFNFTVDQVDKLTGPVIGRPKSATYRTCDVVGLDTLVHVAKGLSENCKNDEASAYFEIPDFILKMIEQNKLGSKTGEGFFKKFKSEKGSEIRSLNLNTLEYEVSIKVKFATLETAKQVESFADRLKILINGKDDAGEFYRHIFTGLFAYVSNRVPEIADDIYKIDDAMCAGFGWENGPFELWEMIGIEESALTAEKLGYNVSPWIKEFIASGNKQFYKWENGIKQYYDISSKSFKPKPGTDKLILLDSVRKDKSVWRNKGANVTHIGDGILNLEFHTKMNTLGGEVIEGINKAIEIAEKEYQGLVISNEGANFSAGANLGLIFMLAIEQEWDELNFAIKAFQNAMMRVRYSSVPVVVVPHNLALGGATEMSMHADKVQAHAELYMGLVEFGAGLIPGGGGTKEFALRASDAFFEGDVELATLRNKFLTIGTAKVSTSAHEAFKLGYLREGRDGITIARHRLLKDAKESCLNLAKEGYVMPNPRKDIKVLGRQGLGLIYLGADSMFSGNYISEHDKKISEKLGYVMCGGDLSAPTLVTEQYLLDLEREAFLSLCGEKKTLERMQSILNGGKVLRN